MSKPGWRASLLIPSFLRAQPYIHIKAPGNCSKTQLLTTFQTPLAAPSQLLFVLYKLFGLDISDVLLGSQSCLCPWMLASLVL